MFFAVQKKCVNNSKCCRHLSKWTIQESDKNKYLEEINTTTNKKTHLFSY